MTTLAALYGAGEWQTIHGRHRLLFVSFVLVVCISLGGLSLQVMKSANGTLTDGRNRSVLLGVGILTLGQIALCSLVYTPLLVALVWTRMGEVGEDYMNAMAPGDIQTWVARSKSLMANPSAQLLSGAGLPADLRRLHIVRVNVDPVSVEYIWMGGPGHTSLRVDRGDDGTMRVTEFENEGAPRLLWPKP